MADSKAVTIVPLIGSNYPMWKIQCRMALMMDGLWGIINGTEIAPGEAHTDRHAKFVSRSDRALVIIILSIDPSLLYIFGDPKDPVEVWTFLSSQFQKKTWASKLVLRRRLHSLRLKEGQSIHDHVKALTETFNELSVIRDAIKEEDRVVYLLASLPEFYHMLVNALEANADVHKMKTVIERLVHEEQKLKEHSTNTPGGKSEKP